VEHSLKVYDMAIALRESIIKMRPDMEAQLPLASVAIATLLHDVCKADIYRKVQRARKNEIGIYEKFEEYTVDYNNFPVGHGEKSVIMLLRSGLDLEDEEIFAIRWHMGAWELAQQSIEQERSYRTAQRKNRRLWRLCIVPTPCQLKYSSATRKLKSSLKNGKKTD